MDLEKQTLTYAGAGHPPLLLWGGPNEGVREVEENGLFLGRFPWATYTSVELPFSEGSWALLYTDGIPETTNPSGEEFSTGGFRQFLESDKSSSADQFAKRRLHDLSAWAARGEAPELDDDITVVALHAGSASRFLT